MFPLLTISNPSRRSLCEEPNSSCDDRCNAPVIRRLSSALLFFAADYLYRVSEIRTRFSCRVFASGNQTSSCSKTVTGCPFPLPRFVNHSPIEAASRTGSTLKPASRHPSAVGNVSSNSADPVKLRMQKISSQSRGAGRRSSPITISAFNFRAYIRVTSLSAAETQLP